MQARRTPVVRQRAVAALVVILCGMAVAGTGVDADGGRPERGQWEMPPPPPRVGRAPAAEFQTVPEDVTFTGQRVVHSTGIAARWAYVPQADAFNDALAAWVGDKLRLHAENQGVNYVPETYDTSPDGLDRGCLPGSTRGDAVAMLQDPALAAHPDDASRLVITCEAVQASGSVVALRLRAVSGTAANVASDDAEIFYGDLSTADVATGRGLLTEDGLEALFHAVYPLLRVDAPEPGEQTEAAMESFRFSVFDVVPESSGAFTVAVRREFVAEVLAGDPQRRPFDLTLRVPSALTAGMLTPLGEAVVAAARNQRAWAGPSGVASGSEYVDCNLVPCVALTWDDGPSPYTPSVLDAFAALPYAATTFFVLGSRVAGNEATLQRAVAEGHLVENHSWNHPNLTGLRDDPVLAQAGDTTAAIQAVTEVPVTYFRPPYGASNPRIRSLVGLPSIQWSIDTNDWRKPGVDALIDQVVWGSRPDDIVLLHDIHADSVAAAQPMVDGLLGRGFTLVTLDQLFGGSPPAADASIWTSDDVRAYRH